MHSSRTFTVCLNFSILICLQAVIRGQQESRWLRSFLSAKRRRVVNIYLEDDQQLDRVYWYLNELYAKAVPKSPRLADVKSMEHVPFVLDVLLPEVREDSHYRLHFCTRLSFYFLTCNFLAGYHICHCWGGQRFGQKGRREVPERAMH